MRKRTRIIKSIPNTMTFTSLFFGFSAILASLQAVMDMIEPLVGIEPQPERYLAAAGIFILLGCFADLFDGMLARLLKSESEFGRQMDSLADLITFGIAPGVLFYTITLFAGEKISGSGMEYKIYGLIPDFIYTNLFIIKVLAFVFPICAGVRLAKFNYLEPTGHFVGVPSTFAGGMVALTFTFNFFFTPTYRVMSWIGLEVPSFLNGVINFTDRLSHNFLFLLVLYCALGLLMISPVKFKKFKDYFRNFKSPLHKKLFIGGNAFFLILFFKYYLFLAGMLYLIHNLIMHFTAKKTA